MTDQTNAPASNDNSGKGYNLTLTPIGAIDTTPAANDTRKIRFRAKVTLQGKEKERTVIAQGKAADAVADMIKDGVPVSLRVLFSRAPSQEDGKQGGEYLTVLGIPLPKKKAA